MASKNGIVFEDFFPSMLEKLGAEGFIDELCNGFLLLMDGHKGVITFESLKKNSAVLGLQNMSDEELKCMLKEGDLDGDLLPSSPPLDNSGKKKIDSTFEQGRL
ncbi:hypothetical protein ACSBR2_024401 [Camellia fascicularis]